MSSLTTLFIGLGVSAISAATILATTASIGPLLAASLSGSVGMSTATFEEPVWSEAPIAHVELEPTIAGHENVAAGVEAVAAQAVPRASIEASIFSPHG